MSKPGVEADVSRETFLRLQTYVDLLEKWTRKINLVAPASMAEVWQRHVADSLQLIAQAPKDWRIWADLGSGGGFPGMVIGIVALEQCPDSHVHLVESDARKAAFLRTVARETIAPVTVHTARAEALPGLDADVVSARALAPLTTLLPLAQRHLAKGGVAVFPKGITWEKEVAQAREEWLFDLETAKSKTDPRAVLLRIKNIAHA